MANVHGRLTGEAGVCLGTLGPGATNLMTGVADANLDKAPSSRLRVRVDWSASTKRATKRWTSSRCSSRSRSGTPRLNDPEIITESVRKAFKLAEYEKPGATHLEFPEDVAGSAVDATPMDSRERVRLASPDSGTASTSPGVP